MLRILGIVLVISALLPSGGYAQNLIRNPSFENVPCNTPCGQDQGLMPSDWFTGPYSIVLPPADTLSNDGSYGLPPGSFGHFPGVLAADGKRWVAAVSYPNVYGLIEFVGQTLTAPLTPRARYTLTASVHRDNGSTGFAFPTPGSWRVELWSTTTSDTARKIVVGELGIVGGNSWVQQTLDFVAPADVGTYRNLVFVPISSSATAAAYPALDNVSLTGGLVVQIVPQIVAGSYDGGQTKYGTIMQVVNHLASPVTVSADFFSEDGSLAPLLMRTSNITRPTFTGSLSTLEIQSNSVLVITADAAPTGTILWGKFTTSAAITISTLFESRDTVTNVLYGRVGVNSSEPDMRQFLIPRIRNTTFGLDTGFALVNTGTTAATLTATLRTADGATVATDARTFAAGQHLSVFAKEYFGLANEPSGALYQFMIFESASPQFAVTALGIEGATLTSFPVNRLQ